MTSAPQTPRWTSDLPIDLALATSLIQQQFPDLAASGVRVLGEGWDNLAVCAGPAVFRFPRRRIAVPFLESELATLPTIAPGLPLPIPVPRWIGRPAEVFPYPWAGYLHLSGTTLCRADTEDRRALAGDLGRFLAALHRLPVPPGLVTDTIGRLDSARRIPRTVSELTAMAALGLPIDGIAEAKQLPTRAPTTTCVVHGDLYARHVLVHTDGTNAGHIAGIIDWGDVHHGDPGADLMAVFMLLPPACHDRFRDAYGPIDDATWTLAWMRAVWHTVAVAPYAHRTSDAALMRAVRHAWTWIRQTMPSHA